ncbi:MAG: hypothetical protein M1608_14130 [Candidatus Omnitrophica bacterium]|nr:hypothetical protein [Candidatus Omnitrophota bacterium]
MKIKLSTLAALLLVHFSGYSQSAETLITQGRAYLAAHDLANANASFAGAVQASPNNETANALLAATRLLVLPGQPAAQGFMDRLGITPSGRDIYHWTARLPMDSEGRPLSIPNMNFEEGIALLRTNLLPEVTAAEANLAKVVSTNFLLNLSSNETAIADVSVDYGDILLLRAMLHAVEYLGYTLNGQNLSIQLSAIYAFATNKATTLEQVAADYPSLFTFSTTNDLAAAKAAFQNAVDRYMDASAWIRSRNPGVTRLFNYDPSQSEDESRFRQLVADLKNSLNGPVAISLNNNYTIHLARHFDGSTSFRQMLPDFYQNGVVLGSLPDPTFGGLVFGLTAPDVEEFLGGRFDMYPVFRSVGIRADKQCQLQLISLDSRSYAVEGSSDMRVWSFLGYHSSTNGVLVFTDPDARGLTRRFYRAFEVPSPR